MEFNREDLTSEMFYEELQPLLYEWWKVWSKPGAVYGVNLEVFMMAQDANMLRMYTLRDDDSILGVAIFMLFYSYREENQFRAELDTIYIAPEARKGMTGVKLIKYAETELFKEVDTVSFGVSSAYDYSKLLVRQGYEQESVIYAKRR